MEAPITRKSHNHPKDFVYSPAKKTKMPKQYTFHQEEETGLVK